MEDEAMTTPAGKFPASPKTIPGRKIRTARGGTNLYGKLMRIGDAEPAASVRLDDGSSVEVEMSRRLVGELESLRRLHRRVGFEGVATWETDGWKVIEFKADRIIPLSISETKLGEMFDSLSEAADGRWDDVDAEAFIDRLRGRMG